MPRNILISALAFCLCLSLSGCGFLLAPVAGTAATAAQLSVKGADKGIEYSKKAAADVTTAAITVLRPATREEAAALEQRASQP